MARASEKLGKLEEKIEEKLGDASAEDLQAQVEQLKEDIAALAATLANLRLADCSRSTAHGKGNPSQRLMCRVKMSWKT